jgi:L,D-peptidoglycan transpeptidase YkuD (ErfK/YbiS/YcfS/YnhG family)
LLIQGEYNLTIIYEGFIMKNVKKANRLKKRIIALTLSVLTAALLLTSCNSAPSKNNTSESSKSSDNSLAIESQKVVDSPKWLKKLDAAKDCDQLIVVAGVGKSTCYVSMHEKDKNGKWKMILQAPGYVGLEGMGKADSYHATTPIGTFTIDKAFGIADDPGCQMEYTKVTEDDYWSGDMREGMHFNEFININDVPDLDKNSSEHLIDYTYEYTYCLNMGYNSECVPGEGSCFFFHCMSLVKPYTGGCVAVNEAVMKVIMQNVREGCKITINTADALGIDLNEARDFANMNV